MIPTVAVTFQLYRADGTPDVGASVMARLDRLEVDSGEGYVLPTEVYANADENGQGTMSLWPNELGSTESVYRIIIEGSEKTERLTAVVPNVPTITLEACATLPAYAGKTDGEIAVEEAVQAGSDAFAHAAAAEASATAAAGSATAAAASATTASNHATTAGTHATNASGSATAAAGSADDASGSATAAAASATAAGTSATNAAGSATAAANSATTASGHAGTATTKAGEAAASATAAASSASTASTHATTATTKATEAATSATNAASSAATASTKATEAAASATTAANQATIATNKATEAESSAGSATTQAGVASTQAGIATSKATEAAGSANAADNAANTATTKASEAAASAAAASGHVTTASNQAQIATDKAAEATARASEAYSSYLGAAGTVEGLNEAQQIMLGYANTATAAVSQAQAHATAAASVAQQDLSGVVAAALHRAPGAVVAMTIYDTSKDSDGGAWIERMAHTSWQNEALNGVWLGAHASEAAARAVPDAATGDFFQLTTDGKFYKLNEGAGTAEVFRGNTAKFPRVAAIVAEAARVVIYDLMAPGRPMWMVFRGGVYGTGGVLSWSTTASITAIAVREGRLMLGGASTSLLLDFAADRFWPVHSGGYRINGAKNIGERNNAVTFAAATGEGIVIANASVNAVAMTTMPDAPVDQGTGTQVPTVVLTHNSGASIIRHDGSVVAVSDSWANRALALHPDVAFFSSSNTPGWVYQVRKPGSNNAISGAAPLHFLNSAASPAHMSLAGRSELAGLAIGATVFNRARVNESTSTAGLSSSIAASHNAGWLSGDIRRAWGGGVDAGTMEGVELVSNGTFDSDLTGWTTVSGTTGVNAGRLRLTSSGNDRGVVTQALTVTPGKTYRVRVGYVDGSGGGGPAVRISTANSYANFDLVSMPAPISGAEAKFTPTTATVYLHLIGLLYTPDGLFCEMDDISVKEAVSDRTYKNKAATVYGTLALTPVAAAAQLCAISGFSATNYVQEPYSADLDFGTGPWTAGFLGSIPTNVAAVGVIVERRAAANAYISFGHDATGKLTATAHDGTTARTITTAATYATGQILEAHAAYTSDGKLAIWVNGREVASTTGAPLLTMSNASAVCTVGNSRALDAPFSGSIVWAKWSATAPSVDAMAWMWEQHKQMVRDGSQVTLPDAGAIVDMDYDQATGRWIVASAANESEFSGLVRVATRAVSAGSISKVAGHDGMRLVARTTSSPGVDVTLPALDLKEELLAHPREARPTQVFDFDAVAAQTDFALPAGWEAVEVIAAGTRKREGSTKDYTRLFDGFKEAIRFAVAPGAATWVQIIARRMA